MFNHRLNHRGPLTFDGAKVHLKANADGTVQLTCGGRQFKSVRIKLGRPLYKPEDFATVFGSKGNEVGLLVNLSGLPASSSTVLEAHRLHHNLTTAISRVYSLTHQFGAAYWDVETEKGRRQFVIRGTTEHIRFLEDERLLITDVQGNRFEIPNLANLDPRSQRLIHLLL